jgi:hypothetical protein
MGAVSTMDKPWKIPDDFFPGGFLLRQTGGLFSAWPNSIE